MAPLCNPRWVALQAAASSYDRFLNQLESEA
jgi:hypothetical protein